MERDATILVIDRALQLGNLSVALTRLRTYINPLPYDIINKLFTQRHETL